MSQTNMSITVRASDIDTMGELGLDDSVSMVGSVVGVWKGIASIYVNRESIKVTRLSLQSGNRVNWSDKDGCVYTGTIVAVHDNRAWVDFADITSKLVLLNELRRI